MTNKIKIVALFGASGSGKDTIKKELLKNVKSSKGIISNTTRPPRDYEKDGIDYKFLTAVDFTKKILDGSMIEATSFNDWFYGTSIESLDKNNINIGVFSPAAINCLWSDSRLSILPIYIKASDKTRLIRQLNRENYPNCDEVCRRYFSDKKDFQEDNFDFDYCEYENENEIDIKKIINIIDKNNFEIGED